MKKIACAACVMVAMLFSCGPEKKQEENNNVGAMPGFYGFQVTEDVSFAGKLPALQSFVFAQYQQYWIMFAGRTAPFHGFNGGTCDTCYANFPVLKANDSIFVFNTQTKTYTKAAIPAYGGDTANVFFGSNLPHTQVGNSLYACGGYAKTTPADQFANKTNSYFMKVDLAALTAAVNAPVQNSAAIKAAFKWGKSPLVRNTGGELFMMPDNNFYLCVGHNYTGKYQDNNATQVYLDSVNVFSVAETGNALTLTKVRQITDGLPDSTTQFHRRDLNVAPGIQADGSIGISIYGGVFTYSSGSSPSNTAASYNFTNPIYINPGGNPEYSIETSANQYSSIYSTAQFCMYDSMGNRMLTTMFGGIGDKTNQLDSNANWTKYITTAERNYSGGNAVTTFNTNDGEMPGYLGAESVFIPVNGLPIYNNNNYGIVNYCTLHDGQHVGYIYGGIEALQSNGNSIGLKYGTSCSNKVYKVVFSRWIPVEGKAK